jgi:nucleoside-diphosphate-sugar epimerase
VFIDDVVTGLAHLGAREGLDGQTVDLGTGQLTSVREVVEQLAALVPEAPPPRFGAVPDRPRERVRAANVAATRSALGWAPVTALAEGLAATLAWSRARLAGLA